MNEKIQGIVLGVIRHSDRHNIVTLFTRERGRMGFLTPAGSGKSARLINARLQPLSIVEADVRVNPTRDLSNLSRFTTPYIWKSLYFHPAKQSITLFLQEFLNKLLKSSAPDPVLYEYIVRSIAIIDQSEPSKATNLHIAFLIGLLDPIGIAPNLENYEKGDWFDMRGGEFSPVRPLHNEWLSPTDTAILYTLRRITMSNASRFRFTAEDRRRVLHHLIRYYSIHFSGLGHLNSLDILTELYHK